MKIFSSNVAKPLPTKIPGLYRGEHKPARHADAHAEKGRASKKDLLALTVEMSAEKHELIAEKCGELV